MKRTRFFAFAFIIHISGYCYGQAPDVNQQLQKRLLEAINVGAPTNIILEQLQVVKHAEVINIPSTNLVDQTFSGQVPCNPNTFWAHKFDSIFEFSLINSAITPTGINYPQNGNLGLAYANDNSGISGLSPTLFSTYNQSGIAYLMAFNGSTWDTITTNPGLVFINCGGSGNHLYIDGYLTASFPSYLSRIYRFTNGNIDTIYSCSTGRKINVADEAVDANGNAYVFIGPASSFAVDTLLVLSPTGTILNSFPITFDGLNAYGSFILGDSLYIGFGPSNSVYPSSLVPVLLNQVVASLGTPIPFNFTNGNFYDLESCNQGVPVGIADQPEVDEHLEIYPNPAQEHINIEIPTNVTSPIKEINLISIHGQQIQTEFQYLDSNRIQLNLSILPGGFYFVKMSTGSSNYYGRFEHIGN